MKRIKRFTILILINILVFTIVIAGGSCILKGSVTAFASDEQSDSSSSYVLGDDEKQSMSYVPADGAGVDSSYKMSDVDTEYDSAGLRDIRYELLGSADEKIMTSPSNGMCNADLEYDSAGQGDIKYALLDNTDNQNKNSISDGSSKMDKDNAGTANSKSSVSEGLSQDTDKHSIGGTGDGMSKDSDTSGKQSSLLDGVNIDDLDGEAKGQINTLYDYINKMKTDVELIQDLNPSDYIDTYIKEGKGDISIDSIAKGVLSLIFKEVKSVLKLVISIVTIVIICSLLKNLEEAFSNDSVSQIAFYACYALIIMVLTKSFLISISVAKDVITNISDFMGALLPILITMIGVAGGFTQAASLDPIILICVVFIPKVYSKVIIPLILMSFVLEFANNLSTEHKISNLCSLIKQAVIWMQGIIITMFIAMLTIRGITSSTIDAVTLKTAKFAIDNFVPIVGKTFSDAIASVAGYSLIIKNAISSIGLLVIVLLMIYPIIKLTLMALIYKLAGALVEPISDSRITKCLSSAGGAMTLIISCVLSVSLMFFILIAIMASSGKYVIGG